MGLLHHHVIITELNAPCVPPVTGVRASAPPELPNTTSASIVRKGTHLMADNISYKHQLSYERQLLLHDETKYFCTPIAMKAVHCQWTYDGLLNQWPLERHCL